jgi:predicted unusual protein kinase regulating ubiquinone biosynthesis (AarF/ABC1/UbiB family)
MSIARVVFRYLQAVRVLTPLIITHVRDRRRFLLFGGRRELSYEQRKARAERMADAFEELGTTYIKLAQFMTTRPDLVPPIYVRAMERLQDEVPAEDYDKVRALLEEEHGKPPEEMFDYFNEEAVSGASIAQVHFAGIDGEDVAVKVRRPGLEKTVEADLAVLSFFLPLARKLLLYMGQESHAESAEGIAKELKKTIQEEMNFEREANIMTEIRENIERDGLDDRIIIPYVFHEYSTEKVIVMRYEEGIAVKHDERLKREGHDPEEIVDAIADAYLHMAFNHDVFHADPHQGNLAVAPDGRAIIYDYGIAQRPPKDIQQKWKEMFIGVGMHDSGQVVDALQEMGAVDQDVDRETLLEVANVMIMDISGQGLDDADIERIEAKVDETLYDYPMKFPQEIILGMRATFGVEGLCADLAPEYDFSQKLHDFFLEDIDEDQVPEISHMGKGPQYRVLDGLDKFLGGVQTSLPIPYLNSERPVTAFILDNAKFLGVDLMDHEAPMENGHTDADNVTVDIGTDDIKEDVEEEMKKSSKRTFYTILGGTFVLSAAVLHTNGSGLAPYSFGLGALLFLFAWRSFRERETGVMGPKYVATRHRIEQWDDPEEEDDEVVEDAPMGEPGVSETNGDFDRVGREDDFERFDKAGAKEARIR